MLRRNSKLFTIQAHFKTDNMIKTYTVMCLGGSDTEVVHVKAFNFNGTTFQKKGPLRSASCDSDWKWKPINCSRKLTLYFQIDFSICLSVLLKKNRFVFFKSKVNVAFKLIPKLKLSYWPNQHYMYTYPPAYTRDRVHTKPCKPKFEILHVKIV